MVIILIMIMMIDYGDHADDVDGGGDNDGDCNDGD